eukprot:15163909-Alexandrium_andersonii.AAC.1
MMAASERARHEGNVAQPLGETARGGACAIVEDESAVLAELMLRPMTVLSMAQTIGVPRGCDVIILERASVNAPWRSAVIGDSTLACIEAKSNPERPSHKYVTSMAME